MFDYEIPLTDYAVAKSQYTIQARTIISPLKISYAIVRVKYQNSCQFQVIASGE